jgi:hypothetical protein
MRPNLYRAIPGLLGLCLILIFRGCYEEVPISEEPPDGGSFRVISFNQVDGVVDTHENIIFFTIPSHKLTSFTPIVNFYNYSSVRLGQSELVNGELNELGEVEANRYYPIYAINGIQTDTFRLLFTTLPVIHITTYQEIPDEPKVLSRLVIQYGDQSSGTSAVHSFKSLAGIEIRGGSAMRYDKKSYGLELWENVSGTDYSASLLGMAFMEDWILDAMYIDNLRMRNKISFELWKKMSHTPSEDQRDYLAPGIECRMVELILNNRYQGIYNLNEKLNARLLQYKSDQHEKGGVLYKGISWSEGSTLFETYNSPPPRDYFWDGWEQVYPDNRYSWNALAELRQLIVYAEDDEFESKIVNMIDLDNAVDYYLFVNLIRGFDNAGKNIFLARYTDQSRFFIVPWDMDGSWGIWWDGTKSDPEGMIKNQLFTRLKETNAGDFEQLLESAWKQFRGNIFSEESLLSPISKYYTEMVASGAFKRENSRWDDISIDPQLEYEFISTWIEARLRYLDEKFDD